MMVLLRPPKEKKGKGRRTSAQMRGRLPRGTEAGLAFE